MSETIPEDVMKAAEAVWLNMHNSPYLSRNEETALIARAILSERDRATAAERDRCAKKAANAVMLLAPEITEPEAVFEATRQACVRAIERNPMEGRG